MVEVNIKKQASKDTNFGELPLDWLIYNIGEISSKIGSGITPRGGERVYKKFGVPFIRSQNIRVGFLSLDEVAFIDSETHDTFKGTELKIKDVLLNITGASIGRSALVDDRIAGGNVNQHVCIIRPEKTKMNPEYLCQYLNSRLGQKLIQSFQAGGNREGLNFAQIASIKIPIPKSSEEQKAIATALTDMDDLILSLEKFISKKKLIKEGAMEELLTGKKRLDGFKNKWDNIVLGKILKFQTGFPFKSEYFNQKGNGIRLIKNRDLKNDDQVYYYSGEYLKEYIVNNGDVLVSMDGEFIPCLWKKNKSLLNQRVGRIIELENININYIRYSLIKPLIELQRGTCATTVKHLSHGDIENMQLYMPVDVSEQNAIANILLDMDNEIEKLEKKLNKYKNIKSGMMEELLTGKRRLV